MPALPDHQRRSSRLGFGNLPLEIDRFLSPATEPTQSRRETSRKYRKLSEPETLAGRALTAKFGHQSSLTCTTADFSSDTGSHCTTRSGPSAHWISMLPLSREITEPGGACSTAISPSRRVLYMTRE